MFELLLVICLGVVVINKISDLKRSFTEKIEELENSVHFLNEKVNSLKKQLDKQRQDTDYKKPDSRETKVAAAKYTAEKPHKAPDSDETPQTVAKVPDKPSGKHSDKTKQPDVPGNDFGSLSFVQKGKDLAEKPPADAGISEFDKPKEALPASSGEPVVAKTEEKPSELETPASAYNTVLRPEDAKYEWLKRNQDAADA
ncbi:MAG TPA: hypothetical protein DCG57_05080, partial [Candidatus Riflebacteria bacterium]|nr:hypothetical protein [Candidatus Riflebacteria bacterium]